MSKLPFTTRRVFLKAALATAGTCLLPRCSEPAAGAADASRFDAGLDAGAPAGPDAGADGGAAGADASASAGPDASTDAGTPFTGARPGYMKGQPVRTWLQIPNSKLSQVDPRYSALNPNAPNDDPYGWGFASLVGAWSGAAFDRSTGLWLSAGEGHQDGSGNEVVAVNLTAAAPTAVLRKPPSTQISALAGGKYGDDSPVARHTYWNLVAYAGELWMFGGASYPNGNAIKDVWRLDASANWVREYLDPYPGGLWGDHNAWGFCAPRWEKDGSLREVLWSPGTSDAPCRAWDLQTKTWGPTLFRWNPGAYSAARWHAQRGVLVILGGNTLLIWDGVSGHAPVEAKVADAYLPPQYVLGAHGFVHDPKRDVYYLWNGGSDHGSLVTLTPPAVGEELTGTWTFGKLVNTGTPPSFAAAEDGRPDNAAYGGTFGRLELIPEYDAVFLYSRVEDDLSFLLLS
ncbi:MAG: hypothetical protein QM765_17205 [Myxococcales bacterium]